ncbi:hypothetical protein ABG768_005660, partial [Culter alburnus]
MAAVCQMSWDPLMMRVPTHDPHWTDVYYSYEGKLGLSFKKSRKHFLVYLIPTNLALSCPPPLFP